MTDRELRKLSRRDLLKVMVDQEKQNDKLRERVSKLETLMKERTVMVENAGTLAEAAMLLSGVFERADKAAEQYLESLKMSCEQQQAAYDEIIAQAEQRAKEIIASAESEKLRRIREADAWVEYRNQRAGAVQRSEAMAGDEPAETYKREV